MIKNLFSICLYCIAFIGNANSQHWQGLNLNLSYPPSCFFTDTLTDKLFIGGGFKYANNIVTNQILTWDGLNFQPIGSNLAHNIGSAQMYAITRFNQYIYLATGSPFLPRWDGSQWDTLGLFNESIISLCVNNNELYVGGYFTEVNGISTNCVAKWDGSQWHSLNYPYYNENCVRSIAMYKGELYIGGDICDSTGYSVCVARYDGANWHRLGNGLKGFYAGVSKMVVYKGELYIAGSFSKTDYAGNPGNYIAKWDGSNWSDVGGGVMGIGGGNGQIFDLEIYHDELYAVGDFSYAGGVHAQYIAKWNGTNWCGLGSIFENTIGCLGVYQDMLYIGGGFLKIDGDSIRYLAKWTGGSYVDTCSAPSGIEEISNSLDELNVYPNPFSSYTILKSSKPLQNATLSIYDVLGKEIKTLQNLNGTEIIINREGLKSGMYFYDLIDSKGLIGRGKMIVE